MRIELSAPHSSITPALDAAVHDKLSRLDLHANKALRAHVVLHSDHAMQPENHRVDMTVRGAGKPLVASATGSDMYAAINEAAHMIDRQWRKRKTSRLKDIRHTQQSIKRSGQFA